MFDDQKEEGKPTDFTSINAAYDCQLSVLEFRLDRTTLHYHGSEEQLHLRPKMQDGSYFGIDKACVIAMRMHTEHLCSITKSQVSLRLVVDC